MELLIYYFRKSSRAATISVRSAALEQKRKDAYDAYVLASAMNHRAPLLTLDRGLQRAAKEARVKVLEVDS